MTLTPGQFLRLFVLGVEQRSVVTPVEVELRARARRPNIFAGYATEQTARWCNRKPKG